MTRVSDEFLGKFEGTESGTIDFLTTKIMALELIELRKQKLENHYSNVWENAPENAGHAKVYFKTRKLHGTELGCDEWNRQIPKTRVQIIAEKNALAWAKSYFGNGPIQHTDQLVSFFEAAINEALESKGNPS